MTLDKLKLEFAVVGHPNEGKSSVVATLVEDDTIRISPWPGETLESRAYPVQSGDVIRLLFTDTPGFQSPRRALEWIRAHEPLYTGKNLARAFFESHSGDPDFRDECQIFSALARGAGILYVVDAARPVRKSDLAEMEILRLVGLPRMAIINPKNTAEDVEEWKTALRKTFNAVHVFNALTAGFRERMRLLGALRAMDPDVEPVLHPVIRELEQDWEKRIAESAARISDLLAGVASFSLKREAPDAAGVEELSRKMTGQWQEGIRKLEERCWNSLRDTFRHRFFAPSPDLLALVETDLLSKEAFHMFGLSRRQLAALGGGAGAAVAAGVDLALGGAALGLVTAAGGVAGAAWSYFGTRSGDARRMAGVRISGVEICIGPVKDTRIPWMVLDRSLLLFHALITRPHATREKERHPVETSLLYLLEGDERKRLAAFIRDAARRKLQENIRKETDDTIASVLSRLASGSHPKK
ncbi:GTPase/DUF3482 domain-containing protein [Desulfobotulus sp. H1]|uniref:GTPase/DUF3482 domain-containing protein n=1 Tax=Desulfobotulus pelophilus TaxID=2823377 RepID=A0ABT3N866_9BACT|nr:GTPase/DUF3482 domain-containing protein [Desulfobotulus pelophilus]MCW7753653.1 GTPase/DUF3482 domain-containing protein [Desulfobotulus pelophilus]